MIVSGFSWTDLAAIESSGRAYFRAAVCFVELSTIDRIIGILCRGGSFIPASFFSKSGIVDRRFVKSFPFGPSMNGTSRNSSVPSRMLSQPSA